MATYTSKDHIRINWARRVLEPDHEERQESWSSQETGVTPVVGTGHARVNLFDGTMPMDGWSTGTGYDEGRASYLHQKEIAVPAATTPRRPRKDSVGDVEDGFSQMGSACKSDICPENFLSWEREYEKSGGKCLTLPAVDDYVCKAGTCVACLDGIGPPGATPRRPASPEISLPTVKVVSLPLPSPNSPITTSLPSPPSPNIGVAPHFTFDQPRNEEQALKVTDGAANDRRDSSSCSSASSDDDHKQHCRHNNNILGPPKRASPLMFPPDAPPWLIGHRRRSGGKATEYGSSDDDGKPAMLICRR